LWARRIAPDTVRKVVAIAIAWLGLPSVSRAAVRHRTLGALLHRAPLLYDAQLAAVLDDTLRWIREAKPPAGVTGELLHEADVPARRLGRLAELRAFSAEAYAGEPVGVVAPSAASSFKAYRRLAEELTARARNVSAPADPSFVRSVLAAARKQLEKGRVVETTFVLPGLLPLGLRTGDAGLWEEVQALAREVLRDGLPPGSYRGLTSACFRLVDAGSFADKAEGERLLDELGLHRPAK
jgi:hypothetical protein